MAKAKVVYQCSECGYISSRWLGKCPDCGNWNTLNESVSAPESSASANRRAVAPVQMNSVVSRVTALEEDREVRRTTGLAELDRVLGGGMVDGSVVLLSGDPGIGKSTLLLQICDTLCRTRKVLYVTGEESPRQIKLRAMRLNVSHDELYIAALTDVEQVLDAVEHVQPDVVMIDSIQTMNLSMLSSSSGSVTQVRECATLLIRMAKQKEIPIFLIGHVNKDGGIAGPKVLEHVVDVVLYFEGERHSAYRILRSVKNRYGSTNEIGVFEMGDTGLSDVENPSLMLLSGRPVGVSGTCVACVMEGTRPILAEVQALVSKTGFGTPRRMSTGFDFNRAALLVAVLEKRGGFFFGNLDAYINIIGGLRLDEPAADLPVAMALISNLLDKPVPEYVVSFGEIGLAGEVRSVSHAQQRVNECMRLGFTHLFLPKSCMKGLRIPDGMDVSPVSSIMDVLSALR